MPVAFNNSAANAVNTGGSTSVTFSYTVGSGSDRLLLVQRAGSANPTAITYAGASLTEVGSLTGELRTWTKTAPATGSNTLAFTVSSYTQLIWSAADFSGVDQTTPLGGQVSNTSASSSAASTGSITVPADGAAWGGIMTAFATTGSATMSAGTLASQIQTGGAIKAGGYRLSTGDLVWDLPSSPAWSAQGFPINASVPPATLSGEAILSGITADGGFTSVASSLSGEAVLSGITAEGGMGLAPGVITTPVLKNNTGTILASVSGIVANIYHPTTGALVVRKTGLTSNGSGIVTISDVLLVAGTTYAYEIDLSASSQGRRLPTGIAA